MLLAAGLAAAAWPSPAAATTGQVWVPYPALLAQVRTGPLIRAIINPARMDVEIKFRNLDEWHAYYPAGAQPELQALLRRRHVRVIFVARPATAATHHSSGGHPLRWALAGAVAAALDRRRGAGRPQPPPARRALAAAVAPPPRGQHEPGAEGQRCHGRHRDPQPVRPAGGPRGGRSHGRRRVPVGDVGP